MAADIQNAAFTNHDKAREVLEAIRWPDGPICPHCGNSDQFVGRIAIRRYESPRWPMTPPLRNYRRITICPTD